ncbi:Ribosomal RNA small subunit methyltransferase D [Vibrio aerogenes CECT 7868]|uniref:Ribosomal RNA small subunit methyltransferase D n=1 Tax=Vibrio aerogenes CECT 7868 TaxID=1216006 RepID=A0A1M6AJM0_9VIBR|nr:16S rRNA (guanine(966)-N(2))-methyltransferase RsmD [Vibrio aerogenes]SHI36528.1 Ribosomal RNA small subunit methyltransferase D [Vibrio aerogenes CECT 7868]
MGKHRHSTKLHSNKPSGFIRLISGEWRGRKLPVHNAEGLRPTTDRVKETLFNWLSPDIPFSRCLDLFSGSGSLGFEAASRQAQLVTMLELDSQAFRQLQTNKETLSAETVDIIQADTLNHLARHQPETPYDIIFIDPPFRQGITEKVIKLLEDYQWVADGALIYLETEKEWQPHPVPAHWQLHREKTAGQVCYRLYHRN